MRGTRNYGNAGAAWPVQGLLRHIRGEIERRIDEYTGNPYLEPVRVAAD